MIRKMVGKTTIHLGKKYSRNHNLRTEKAIKDWNKDNHIDYDKTKFNVVLCDMDLKEFFKQTFGDALMQFNENNYKKHPERLIGVDAKTFVEKQNDSNYLIDKAVSSYYSEQKKNVQEAIIQMSDSNNFKQLCDEIGFEQAINQHKEFLTKVYNDWQLNNPNLKIFSAVIHCDETTPHLHIDFVFVAETNKGLTTKVSIDGALKNMGFDRVKNQKYADTPYKQWLRTERTRIDDIASEYMTVRHAEPSVKGHTEYYQHKYKKIIEHINDIEQMLADEEVNLKNKQADLEVEIERIRILSQKVNQIYEDNLKKQRQIDEIITIKAKAYVNDMLQKINIDLSTKDIEQANQEMEQNIKKIL